MSSNLAARLTKPVVTSIREGHPWLFADAVDVPADARTGDVVDVVDDRGRFVARGLFEADAPIAVRVWTARRGEAVDGRLAERRVFTAAALRATFVDRASTDTFRMLHGEGDRLPGIVVDRYGDTAVLVLDTPAAKRFVGDVAGAIRAAHPEVARVVHKVGVRDGPARLDAVVGPPLSGPLVVREHGMRFEVDVARGHKTGLYLDQRESRRRVRALAAGRRVLNLFAYTGGFTVAAALGGAAHVTSVDVSEPVLAAARRNVAQNGFQPAADRFAFVAADAFAWLADRPAGAGERYDLVIVDPPSMAPSRRARARALDAYRRLNALALARVAPGGLLLTCSCSSHVSTHDLMSVLAAAGREAHRAPRVVEVRGAGPDHPVPAGFPEGRYLDALLAFVP